MMGYERGTRVHSDRKEQNTYLYRQVFDFYYLKSHLINLSVSRYVVIEVGTFWVYN